MTGAQQRQATSVGCRPPLPAGTNGRRLSTRPLERSDADRIVTLVEQLSPESRYLRFFGPVQRLPPPLRVRLTSIDHEHHEAVGVFDGTELVGAAHYVRSDTGVPDAEISIEVAEDHQHQGVGTRLVWELAELARSQGVSQLRATMLAENRAAVSLMRHFGWPTVSRSDGPELTMSLQIAASPELR